ncbi:MAG: type II toxin-antitoxin system VapC family toxin [Pyrinomonadaceae bacterium]
MPFLLDTNALSEFLKKTPNQNVIRWFSNCDASEQFVSAITIGEIQKGISKLPGSRRKNDLNNWLDELIVRFDDHILPFDVKVARRWGEMLDGLEKLGSKPPVLDGQIAATALEYDLTVVTRNIGDFSSSGAQVLNSWE